MVETAPLERVVQVPGAVGGENHHRRNHRAPRAELRDRHRRLREHLEKKRLELVVGPVHFVDEQHRRAWPGVVKRGQQRPGEQELLAEQVGLPKLLVGGLGQPDGKQLLGVVPLVQRLGRGDALVALQPHERGVQRRGERLGRLGLADARLTFQQDRLPHPHRKKQRRRQLITG